VTHSPYARAPDLSVTLSRIAGQYLTLIFHQHTGAKDVITSKRRKWNWVGHTLRKEVGAIEKTALEWNSQGYGRRGRPKRAWRRTIEDEIRGTGRSWNEVKGKAGDRNAWKIFMDALCSTRSKRT
jgi:hypothetical protein